MIILESKICHYERDLLRKAKMKRESKKNEKFEKKNHYLEIKAQYPINLCYY